jgi:predicted enzyme related to lactoylglutathione lyase
MHDPFKTPGAFSWNELMSTDPVVAKAFYQGLFGWQLEDMDMGPEGTYTVVKTADGEAIGGVMGMPPGAEGMPSHWGAYVTVADTDATVSKAEALGAKVIVPPRDIPKVGRFAVFHDPQGATLAVIAYAPCD